MKDMTDRRLAVAIAYATDQIQHALLQPRSLYIAGQLASYRLFRQRLLDELLRRAPVQASSTMLDS